MSGEHPYGKLSFAYLGGDDDTNLGADEGIK
jgi:hypothetical protein